MNSYFREKIYNRLRKNMKIIEGNCHIYTGKPDCNGYAVTYMFGKIWKVHRLSTLFFMDLDLDIRIYVRHKCKNRNCFNPTHLIVKIKNN